MSFISRKRKPKDAEEPKNIQERFIGLIAQ